MNVGSLYLWLRVGNRLYLHWLGQEVLESWRVLNRCLLVEGGLFPLDLLDDDVLVSFFIEYCPFFDFPVLLHGLLDLLAGVVFIGPRLLGEQLV